MEVGNPEQHDTDTHNVGITFSGLRGCELLPSFPKWRIPETLLVNEYSKSTDYVPITILNVAY